MAWYIRRYFFVGHSSHVSTPLFIVETIRGLKRIFVIDFITRGGFTVHRERLSAQIFSFLVFVKQSILIRLAWRHRASHLFISSKIFLSHVRKGQICRTGSCGRWRFSLRDQWNGSSDSSLLILYNIVPSKVQTSLILTHTRNRREKSDSWLWFSFFPDPLTAI